VPACRSGIMSSHDVHVATALVATRPQAEQRRTIRKVQLWCLHLPHCLLVCVRESQCLAVWFTAADIALSPP
jgi:hypothetical protein